MKVIIAGSRTITDYALLLDAIAKSEFNITEVVSGGAAGVDAMGERWARENGVQLTVMNADWSQYKRAAGRVRNSAMASYGEALIAITTGSPGTRNMIGLAKLQKLPTYVHTVSPFSTRTECSVMRPFSSHPILSASSPASCQRTHATSPSHGETLCSMP